MFGTFSFSWFMLPLGVALGVYWARQSAKGGMDVEAGDPTEPPLPALESSDLDLQLALGSVLRKNGEMERALALHQTLLARNGLNALERARVRYEVALDHVRAGVIDRAEVILEEMAEQGQLQLQSLELLLQVREQAREWRRAIEVAHRIEALKSQSYKPVIAHYLCELAEEARRANDPNACRALLEEAAATDSACLRAHIALGGLLEAGGDLPAAIKFYRKVAEKNPRFVSEVLVAMLRCHQSAGTLEAFDEFLAEAETRSAHPGIAQIRAKHMISRGADPVAYLSTQLEKSFSPAALDQLLETLTRFPVTPEALASLRQTLKAAFATSAVYRCDHCGFQPKTLFWQCPSCKHWGSVAPLLKQD